MLFYKFCHYSVVECFTSRCKRNNVYELKEASDSMKNNRSKNTRSGRNNSTDNKLEKVYYIVIGILLLVLIGLVIFIFANRGNNTDQISENPTPDTDEIATDTEEDETETEEEIESGDDATEETDEETDSVEEDEQEEETDNDQEEETTDEENDQEEDQETDEDEETDNEEAEVTTDAPHDESYVPDYNEGSADRDAIASAASSVTGISQGDMTTWWVGNDGPGRVQTTISDSSQDEVYTVYLQYGDGQWHVTNVEELSSVPN